MAVYLWSGAGGAGDGTSFTDAYTTWAAMVTAETPMNGKVIYMAKDHQESGASFTLSDTGASISNRCRCYSMNRTGPVYEPQTSQYNFQASSGNMAFSSTDYVDFYGVYFEATDGTFTLAYAGSCIIKDCTFSVTTATVARYSTGLDCAAAIQCTYKDSTASYPVVIYHDASGGTGFIIDPVYNSVETSSVTNTPLIRGSEGSKILGGQLTAASNSSRVAFVDARTISHIETDIPITRAFSVSTTQSSNSDITAYDDSGASYGREWLSGSMRGSCSTYPTTALYRSGGWVDSPSSTALSWKFEPGTNCVIGGIWGYSLPITSRLATTGSKTFTVYGLHTFTNLYTADVGFWLFYQGTSNSTRWHFASSLEDDPEQATTALTSDTSTWTGRTTETRFKMSQTVTVNHPGEWMVMIVLRDYEAGKFVWIDPKVEIT